MRDVIVRLVGPALIVVFENQGPTRLVRAFDGDPDRDALTEWVTHSTLRATPVAYAALDEDEQGRERGREWTASLAAERRSISELVADLLDRLLAEVV
jgi:hypothetical protein